MKRPIRCRGCLCWPYRLQPRNILWWSSHLRDGWANLHDSLEWGTAPLYVRLKSVTRVYRFRSDLTPDGGLGSPGGSPILEPFLEYPNSEKYGSTLFRSRSSPDLGSVGRRSGRITHDSERAALRIHPGKRRPRNETTGVLTAVCHNIPPEHCRPARRPVRAPISSQL